MAEARSRETVPGSTESGVDAAAPRPRAPHARAETYGTTRFFPGDVLANRYRIVRFVDRGGMGEVYEARDLELRERIALKCVALAHDPDGRTLARLRREVRLARKVTHPNVCRLHDLGFHVEDGQSLAFLTMDFLEGEPLSAVLARRGKLGVAEALPIVSDIARGLDAVHAAGVIHRDLKVSNVMLVSDEQGATRAVLMDFGVALPTQEDEGSPEPTITRETALVGSPAYMSPEQVTGARLTPASDVYALGIVLFQLTTGTLPFEAETALASARMRLHQPPPDARSREPSLPARWDRVIRRCLAREPSDRYASASAVVRALGSSFGGVWLSRQARVAIVAAAGVAALGAWHAVHPAASKAPLAAVDVTAATLPAGEHRRLAVLPFANAGAGADAQWMSTALGEMFGTELATGDRLRLVPGDVIARALRDVGAGPSAAPSRQVLDHVRATTGADFALAGAYQVEEGGRLRLDVALVDALTGRTVAKLAAAGDAQHPFAVVAQSSDDLRTKLGLEAPHAAERLAAQRTHAGNLEAERFYAEGLERERADDLVAAKDRLLQATQADPDFALAHSELADVFRLLGYSARAREEAKKAHAGAKGLPREAELLLEGRLHAVSNEWAAAADAYGALYKFFPDDLDHGIRYARAVLNAGKPNEAFEIIAALRKLPPPVSDDPRLDLTEAIVATKVSDSARCVARATDALHKAERTGSRWVMADAQELLSEAYRRLGEPAKAFDAGTAGRDLYEALGNKRGLAVQLDQLADLYIDAADFSRALAIQNEALGIARSIQHEYRIASLLNRIGCAHHLMGELATAREFYAQSHATWESINEREGMGHTWSNAGVSWIETGDLARARPLLAQALELHRSVGARIGENNANLYLAVVAQASGDPREAERGIQAVVRETESIGDKEGTAEARLALARVQHDLDEREAASTAASSLSIYRDIEHPAESLDAQLVLARIALDDGDARTADDRAREVAAAAEMRGIGTRIAPALALRARALIARARASEALAVATRAAALAETDERLWVKVQANIALAAARAQSGDVDGAARLFEETRRRAERGGFVNFALETRVAAVRALPSDRGAAPEVARLARAKGYRALARQAESL